MEIPFSFFAYSSTYEGFGNKDWRGMGGVVTMKNKIYQDKR